MVNHKKKDRLFSKLVKEECWKKARIVPTRDPSRFRYDSAGNIVCKNLTGCNGLLCHEYDHIVPYSQGGRTELDNCQILQTRANHSKSDSRDMSQTELSMSSAKYVFTSEELDIIEMSVYGNINKVVESIDGKFTFQCECLSEFQKLDKSIKTSCQTPNYNNQTPV